MTAPTADELLMQDTRGEHAARSHWWLRFVTAMTVVFILRGWIFLCVFPPIEGWDEYSHIAYLAYYTEHGTPPVYFKSSVPLTLRPLLLSVPHSHWALKHLRPWGAQHYAQFWSNAVPAAVRMPLPDINLYESMHPPLYYRLVKPFWQALAPRHPLGAIYLLRMINIVWAGLALWVFGVMLGRLVPDRMARCLMVLVAFFQPLYLINAARIANDALAILLGMCALACIMLHRRERFALHAGLAGACVALAVLVKQTMLTVLPVLPVAYCAYAWRYRLRGGAFVRGALAGVLVFGAVFGVSALCNPPGQRALASTQEVLMLRQRGTMARDVWKAVRTINWAREFRTLVYPGPSWIGGWSALRPPRWLRETHQFLMRCAVFALLIGLGLHVWRVWRGVPSGRQFLFSSWTTPLVFGLTAFFLAAGLLFHAALIKATWNQAASNPWYFMFAMPMFLALLLQCVALLSRTVMLVYAGLVWLNFVGTELIGIFWQMAPFYTASHDPRTILTRLARLHPAGFQPLVMLPLALLVAILMFGCLRAMWRLARVPSAQR